MFVEVSGVDENKEYDIQNSLIFTKRRRHIFYRRYGIMSRTAF